MQSRSHELTGGPMMNRLVYSVAKAADVECPKETGELGQKISCEVCRHYAKCFQAVKRAMGMI